MKGFSIFTIFSAKDGMTPVFSKMELSAATFEGKLSRASRNLKKDYGELKNSIMSVGTGLGALAVVTPFKMFADWEKGILSVETLMSKSEAAEYDSRLKAVSKEAIKMNFAVEDANKGLFDTVSALGASDKSLDVYRKSIKLAKGGITDLSVTVDGLTSIVNAYGRETTDVDRAANALFTSQKFGKTTVAELSSNIGKVAPIAKAAGVGYDQLTATMAALTLGGLSTDEATTALRGALSSLIKPSKEASEVMQQLGIPYGVTALRAKGLSYTLKKLNEAQKKNPDLMAKAIPNIRAYTAAMALSEDTLKMIDTIMKTIDEDVKNGTGLNEAFEMMTNSSAAKIDKMLGELKNASISLGGALAPALSPLISGIATLADKLSKVNPDILKFFGTAIMYAVIAKPAILSVKLGMDALAIATSAYGLMSTGVIEAVSTAWWAGGGTVSGALKAIGNSMLWTAKTGIKALWQGMIGLLPAFLPILGISVAILAIGAGFIYAYTHCEKFRKGVDWAVKGALKAFDWLGDKVFGLINSLFEAWGKFWAWLTNTEVNYKPDITGFDKRDKPKQGEFDFSGNSKFDPDFTPIRTGLADKNNKNNPLEININNNTPYPATASGGNNNNYKMQLAGNFVQ